MKKIKSVFMKENMTYKNLIIYSIICGLTTGIIPLIKILDKTSIHNLSECYEMWILLALFIILKSSKPLEAGFKTFIFFLISQPLCYLIQVPFYSNGFAIFNYYPFWLKMTILTFPFAIIIWFLKKENILSMIIITGINSLLIIELCYHFKKMLCSFPYQIIAVIFILIEILSFINLIFTSKKKKYILYLTTIIVLLLIIIFFYIAEEKNQNNINVFAIIQLENDRYTLITKEDNIEVEINNEIITVKGKKDGIYHIKLENSKHEFIELIYVVKDGFSELNLKN